MIWPQSSLKITQAVSLNELVNLPKQFKREDPHYVIDILHWIQCRYLLVRPQDLKPSPATSTGNSDVKPGAFRQDPARQILGPYLNHGMSSILDEHLPSTLGKVTDYGFVVNVPEIAIPTVKKRKEHDPSSSTDQTRYDSSDEDTDDEDIHYEDTDDEDTDDVNFLSAEGGTQSRVVDSGLTTFRPGSLDFSRLPQLALPSYATNTAQKTIQRELLKLQKVQATTPLHELGWYIEFDKIENLFQWIVELHSFDPSLPLAKDMQAAEIASIVLEIRFLRGFPMTPPFIRVIQPRFLPFMNGGGGHVTSGGAMCMELLTNTGWSPVNSMESVFLQVRLAMCNLEPKPARLVKGINGADQYSIGEAVDAYTRAANQHGWEVPKELQEMMLQ